MSKDPDSFPGGNLSGVRRGANRPVIVLLMVAVIIGGAVWFSRPTDAPPMTSTEVEQFTNSPIVAGLGALFIAAILGIIIYENNAVAVNHDTKQQEDEYNRKEKMRNQGKTYSDEQAKQDAIKSRDDYNASAERQLKWTLGCLGAFIFAVLAFVFVVGG